MQSSTALSAGTKGLPDDWFFRLCAMERDSYCVTRKGRWCLSRTHASEFKFFPRPATGRCEREGFRPLPPRLAESLCAAPIVLEGRAVGAGRAHRPAPRMCNPAFFRAQTLLRFDLPTSER